MKILHMTEIQFVSGGVTLDEFRNALRVTTPIAGAVCGLLITNIFDLNKSPQRLAGAALGAIVLHVITEMSLDDEA